ncbi:MAG: aminotransferase class I/II-fold pyridoxal phosphate-dependent enzyme [Rhodospirillales bacterium]
MTNFKALVSSDHPKVLPEILRERAAQSPDRLAFSFLSAELTPLEELDYKSLAKHVDAVVRQLLAHCNKGERALLVYPPGCDFIVAFLACLQAGIIAVPCPQMRKSRDLERMRAVAEDAQPTIVLATTKVAELRPNDSDTCKNVFDVPWVVTDHMLIDERADVPLSTGSIRNDDIAFLQYTSGSTGRPKGVAVSHGNLAHNEMLISKAFQMTEDDIVLGWLPHYHDMGLIGNILQPLVAGIPAYLLKPADVAREPMIWLEAISRFGATVSGGPNFIYDHCVRKAPMAWPEGLDLSQWRLAFNGAEPVRVETMESFIETFAPIGFRSESFYPCYGLAEATLLVSGPAPGEIWQAARFSRAELENGKAIVDNEYQSGKTVQIVSCGNVVGDQRITIVDADTCKEKEPCEIGEIWLSGRSVANGYWSGHDEDDEVFAAYAGDGSLGPYLRTGDLGFVSDDQLFITGRLKDIIILRGRNIFPQDIEATSAAAHSYCIPNGTAAFSIDENGEEKIVVLQEIHRRQIRSLDVNVVLNAIRQTLSQALEIAPTVVLLPQHTLSRTSSGKIRRRENRRRLMAGEMQSLALNEIACTQDVSDTSDTHPNILAELEEILARVIQRPTGTITSDQQFSELGLDSMSTIELGLEIEKRFGVEIGNIENLVDMTVADLSCLCAGGRPSRPASRSSERDTNSDNLDLFEKCHGDGGYFGAYRKSGDRYYTQPVLTGTPGPEMMFDGKPQIVWSINNYLGLVGDPRIQEAAQLALAAHGAWTPMGSRMLTGNTDRHTELESRLATYLSKEAAIVFNYGYMGVMGTIASLVGEQDQIIIDSLSHACIVDGANLVSRDRPYRVFRHNDPESLEDVLRTANRDRRGGILIVTEGVYGMTGDVAPLGDVIALKNRYNARLFVDDAHGFGIMGDTGAGAGEHLGCQNGIDLYFGTFAKTFVGIGGVTAGDAAVIDYIRYNARPHIFAKSLPLVYVEAAHRALDLILSEPERRRHAWAIATRLQKGLRDLGFNIGTTASVITPVHIDAGNESVARDIVHFMREKEGIFLSAVTYPVVPKGVVLLRMTPTAAHTYDHVDRTLAAFTRLSQYLDNRCP